MRTIQTIMADASHVMSQMRDDVGLEVLATGRYSFADLERRDGTAIPPVIGCDELWSRSQGRMVARVRAEWEPLEDRVTVVGELFVDDPR